MPGLVKDVREYRINGLYLEEGESLSLGPLRLRRFQEEVYESLQDGKDILLTAPTGSGKTLTLLLAGEQGGAVGVYPNNTLLKDQWRSIRSLLEDKVKASLVREERFPGASEEEPSPLVIYEVTPGTSGDSGMDVLSGFRYLVLMLVSGRYIVAPEGGRKRDVITNLINQIPYGRNVYTITLTTPDTLLLLLTGAYRSFSLYGAFVHNLLLSSMLGDVSQLLSRTGVGTKKELRDIQDIVHRLLRDQPVFVDEFHLYTMYETVALQAIITAYREYIGWENPFVFSSATPKVDTLDAIRESLGGVLYRVEARPSRSGSQIRGETLLHLVLVDSPGEGFARWFSLGDLLPEVMLELEGTRFDIIGGLGRVEREGKNAFIIIDKLNQIPGIVNLLEKKGFSPYCEASIAPPNCPPPDESHRGIIVGSEAISQGIDRPDVVYGVITGYNRWSVLQRIGRVGRKTDSTVVLIAPSSKSLDSLDRIPERFPYNEIDQLLERVYPELDPGASRLKDNILRKIHILRRELIEANTLAFRYQAMGIPHSFRDLRDRLKQLSLALNSYMGREEGLSSLLRFRGSSFIVETIIGGKRRIVDIGSVLRNYRVLRVERGRERPVVYADLEASRSILCFKFSGPRSQDSRALISLLSNKIFTLGFLRGLGFSLGIAQVSGYRGSVVDACMDNLLFEVPIQGDALGQAMAVVPVSSRSEVVSRFSFLVSGALIIINPNNVLFGFFL